MWVVATMLYRYKPPTFIDSRKHKKVYGVGEVTKGTSKSTGHVLVPLETNIEKC